MGCSHNYVYTQGYFYCTKCGKKSYGKSHKRKQGKKTAIGITIGLVMVIAVFAYSNGIFEINQNKLEKSIQEMPENIQDVSKTAKDVTTETILKIRETIDEEFIPNHLEPVDVTGDNIKNAPIQIQEKNQLGQPIIDKIELEKQVHIRTNQYRIQNGLNTLSWDDALSNIARNHSQDMASRDYFSHHSPEGKDTIDRGTSQGYICQKTDENLIYNGIAENIFQNNLYDSVTIIGIVPIYDWNSQDDLAKSIVDG